MCSEWLEKPIALGAFEEEKLIGYIEGSVESWHNIFRISNVYVEKEHRNKKIAQKLIDKIIEYAKLDTLCRGVMLETQTCNYPAIQVYKKMGFILSNIGIYDFTNNDIENKEARIDLFKKLL